MAMSLERENEFQDRMNKFKSVIKRHQESQVRKITEKGDDQSEYEKSKIETENKQRENDQHAKKVKNVEVESKIKRSRKINELRLSKMKVRFQMIEKIQSKAKEALLDKICDDGQYKRLLTGLLLQGMIKMLEEGLEVKCLKRDEGLVKEAIAAAQHQFRQMCTVQTKMQLSKENLPESDLGGVILTSLKGRIVCSNTLKARLEYALQLSLPEVRKMLFTVEQ